MTLDDLVEQTKSPKALTRVLDGIGRRNLI
jgi:hypothetical protein